MLSSRLYNTTLWKHTHFYRIFLQALRISEWIFILVRFLTFRAPLLTVWTRLPGLKNITPPYPEIRDILGPTRDRPPILLHEGGVKGIAECSTYKEMMDYVTEVNSSREIPRSALKTIFGGLIRGAIIELGPAFIKFAQIVSMRPEIPPFVREELQLLQDSLPAMDIKTTQKIINREMKELGYITEEIFEWIELKPIAAGSLGQVNRAKLRTGKDVVMKVQRAHLEAITTLDGSIIIPAVNHIPKLLPLLKNMELRVLTIAFIECLRNEVNFYLEACTQDEFRMRMKNDAVFAQTVKIANVYYEYTTRKMLTMELVQNFHRADRLTLMEPDMLWDLLTAKTDMWPDTYPGHMVRIPLTIWGEMAIRWGHIHGDPHLGNIYFMEPQDGYGWRVFLCDFGMAEEFPNRYRLWVIDLFRAWMWSRDSWEFLRIVLQYFIPISLIDQPNKLRNSQSLFMHLPDAYHPEFIGKFRGLMFGPAMEPLVVDALPHITMTVSTTTPGELPVMQFKRKGQVSMVVGWLQLALTIPGKEMLEGDEVLIRFFSPHHWFLFKAMLYLEELGSTLFTGASWNDVLAHALKEAMKDYMIDQMEDMNIIELRRYVHAMGKETAIGMQQEYIAEMLPEAVFAAAKDSKKTSV